MKQRTGFTSVLWSSCLAMFAVGANGTAIMAALPTMRTELFLSSAGVQWQITKYSTLPARVIDDWPDVVPVASQELGVIESYLRAVLDGFLGTTE